MRILKLGADAGAVLCGCGEAAVGMSALLCAGLAVPGVALPVYAVLGGILVEALPPDGIVIRIVSDVGEYGALLGGSKSVGVGFLVGAGCNAEEAVLGVDGIEPAVLALSDPRNIVADAPYAVALLIISLGRNKHGKVGLAAG